MMPKSRALVVFLLDTSNLVVFAVVILGSTAGWNVLGLNVLWVMLAVLVFATGRQLLTLAHLRIPTELRQQAQADSTGLAQRFYMSQTQSSFRRLVVGHVLLGCVG